MTDAADRDAAPPLAEAVGGALGIAESVLPSAAFVATYTATGQQTQPALIAAVALAAVFGIARVVRKQIAHGPRRGLLPARPTGQCRLRARLRHLDRGALAAARGGGRDRLKSRD
jgi:hypothetical protein